MIPNSLIFSLNGWFKHHIVMFCCWRISPVNHKSFLSFERWGTFMVLLFWWKLSFHDQTAGVFLFFFPTKKNNQFYLRCSWRWRDWWGRGEFGFWTHGNFVWNSYNLTPKNMLIFPRKIGWGVDLVLMITTVDTKLGGMRILLASSNWKMMILASFPKHSYTCREYRAVKVDGSCSIFRARRRRPLESWDNTGRLTK